jgi:hypothetical protein
MERESLQMGELKEETFYIEYQSKWLTVQSGEIESLELSRRMKSMPGCLRYYEYFHVRARQVIRLPAPR